MEAPLPEERSQLIEKRRSLLRISANFLNTRNFEALTNVYAQLAEISQKLGEDDKARLYLQMKITHEDVLLQLDKQMAQKKKEEGTRLESGIVPTIVKEDREILDEHITERLPYLLDKEKESIIEKLMKEDPGPKRDALLKNSLIKYKKYSELKVDLIKDKLDETKAWFFELSKKSLKGVIGLFDPFQLIERLDVEEIKYLVRKLSKSTKTDLIEDLKFKIFKAVQFYYQTSYDFQKEYSYPINFLGYVLYYDPILLEYFENADFISKYEMINTFADFCADNEINVYDLTTDISYPWDLALLKKETGIIGIAILLTGHEILEKYSEKISKLNSGTEYCDRLYFVTTPLGVIRIGLKKLLEDMERYGAWLYVIDPSHSIIYGLKKGRDSSNKVKEKVIEFKNALKSPLRGLDSHIQFSEFLFDKKYQYKPNNYVIFGLSEYPYKKINPSYIEKDSQNVQYLLLLEKIKGISFEFIQWTTRSIDPDLASGFISAIDSFGSSFSSSTGLEEIKYRGYTIIFAEGKKTKGCLFCKEAPTPRLKELLDFALKKWEAFFKDEIENFMGNTAPFKKNQAKTIDLFHRILAGGN